MKPSIVQVVSLAFGAGLIVNFTGGMSSPVFFLLFLPMLFAVQGGRSRVGVGISILNLVFALWLTFTQQHTSKGIAEGMGIAASFPSIGAVASILHRQLEHRYHALHNENGELSSLLDMSQMMESAFDLDMTLNLVLLNVQKISGCQVCAVYLKTDESDVVELKAASGPRDRGELMTSIPLGDARFDDWSAADTSSFHDRMVGLYVPHAKLALETSQSALLSLDPNCKAFACLPLNCVEGFLGMLFVGFYRTDPLSSGNLARLEQLAARAAFPLHRVMLQQGFQSMAFVDSKTGLDNYRQFEKTLHGEVTRADRYGHRLSLIVLDIDHFKNFNDTYGHPAGDALLAQLAVVLRDSLRGVDKPSRFGGEEFTVICPETGKEEAHVIAERIRRNVEECVFILPPTTGDATEHVVSVTASLGLATYPPDARTASDLLKCADAALYLAKSSGRNAVRARETAETPSLLT